MAPEPASPLVSTTPALATLRSPAIRLARTTLRLVRLPSLPTPADQKTPQAGWGDSKAIPLAHITARSERSLYLIILLAVGTPPLEHSRFTQTPPPTTTPLPVQL